MNHKELMDQYGISLGLPLDNDRTILIDCMDTIVTRDVSLDSLLSLWSKEMGKEFNIYTKFLLNYRRNVVLSAMHNTVNIEEIYGEIYDHCHYFGLIDTMITKESFVKKAHRIELDIELRHQHVIDATVDFLRKEKASGKSVYCVSDFRLPGTDIKTFFTHKGIEDLLTGVFSSCDFGKTKKSGDFYRYVLSGINMKPSECIMIGDNMKSDCINASINGIKSYLFKR